MPRICGLDLVVVLRLRAALVLRLWRTVASIWTFVSTVVTGSALSPDLDVLQYAERVRHEDGGRVVGAHQVGHDGLLADTHEPHGQARLVLVRNARLVQPDHALLLLAGPHEHDRAGPRPGHGDLVAREDRDAAPGGHPVAVQV